MVMAGLQEVIVIRSSDDETEEDEVICLGTYRTTCVKKEKTEPNNKENVSIFIENSPDRKRDKSSFKVNKKKLNSLKKSMRKSRKSNHSSSSKVGNELKINKVRLKKLKAQLQLKIKLDKCASRSPSSGLKMQGKMEIKQDSVSVTNSPYRHQLPIKQPSPYKYQTKSHTGTGSQYLSAGCSTPLNSPHSLTQTTMKTWLTPTKKSSQVAPSSDIAVEYVAAKRNEVVWPPSHVTLNTSEFISRLYKQSRLFPSSYSDIIEGLQDELFLFQIVRTIQSLMSSCMAPSSDLIWVLVKDVLLKSCQQRLSFATYSLLNEIHARFPAHCMAMHIEWQDVKNVTEQFVSCTELQYLNASLSLLFILNILSSEVKSTALKTRTTRLARCFSADFDSRNTRDIVAGIKLCLTKHVRDTCGHSDITKSDTSLSAICSLELFQDLLKLIIVSSCHKEQVARRISDELTTLYIDLPSLEARILLLQTLKSHLVRRYLIEVLLMNYCQLDNKMLQGNEVGARKILLQDFRRCPPKRSSEYGSDRYSAEEIEEYVTLVAYLIQSYMATHTPSLQCVHGDFPLSQLNQVSQFTPDDISLFCNLKLHVSKLQNRCLDFIGRKPQRLSIRTQLMLDMMAIWNDE